ncbi:MAG: putative glycoside hydrolase [Candidatus Pacebacteria bacterium]|nr:putative glycoside hydrolase [Candidatus Paceibacterota bacterium]
MTRSYYTTPLFVITALFALFIVVKNHNIQKEIFFIQERSLASVLNVNQKQVEKLHQQKNIQQGSNLPTPDAVRSIYISSWVASSPSIRARLIDFVEDSEINSVTIDIKDSTGVISYPVSHATITQYYNAGSRVRDIEEFIDELHEKNIYVIGRLTAFQDPALATKHPEFAFKRIDNGGVWTDRKGLAFINPKNKEVWNYLRDIGIDAYNKGFDEINFDYIRYPSDGNISNINYELPEGKMRPEVLHEFYQYLDDEFGKRNIPISADIFGLTTTATDDIGIGQIFEDFMPYFDAVAPMVYPSHYSRGFFGYDNPDAYPYEVIYASMNSAIERVQAIGEDPQKLRPWIQDFSLGINYGEEEVRAQIKATYDLGLDSYMVWDPKNRYTKEAYHNNIAEE